MKVKITYLATDKKIKAIKIVRQYANLSLKDAKAIVDAADPSYKATGIYLPADEPVFEINPDDFSAVADAFAEFGSQVAVHNPVSDHAVAGINLALNAVEVFGSRATAREGLRDIFTSDMPDVVLAALEVL